MKTKEEILKAIELLAIRAMLMDQSAGASMVLMGARAALRWAAGDQETEIFQAILDDAEVESSAIKAAAN